MIKTSAAGLAFCCSLVWLVVPAWGQQSEAPNFIADFTFVGSRLDAWSSAGRARWEARDGVITGNADAGAGLLLSENGYEEVALFTRFRCDATCDAGLLFRLEKTATGMKGVFVSLANEAITPYRVTLDNTGRITAKESAVALPEVILPRIQQGTWNAVEVVVEENAIHITHNEERRAFSPVGAVMDVSPPASAGDVYHYPDIQFGFGPIALYVGSASVEFDDISMENLLRLDRAPEQLSPRFRMQQVNEFEYSWGADAGDFNKDGVLDLVAGAFYFLGPDYLTRFEYLPSFTYNPGSEYPSQMLTFAYDWTGDGWDDVLATEGRKLVLYVNPGGERRHWTPQAALPEVCSEIAIQRDVDDDGRPDIAYVGNDGRLAYGAPDPSNPAAPWVVRKISEPIGSGTGCGQTAHGLGVGDVNGDGRLDLLLTQGWWEQPASDPARGKWVHHEALFGSSATEFSGGGGEIAVYDFNGDGLSDVVTSLDAHAWGLAWYEQHRDERGTITFEQHMIMNNFATRNAGNVTFSELHAGAALADIDGDGVMDFVTGKRHWAHNDRHASPDHNGEAVVYWYRTVRDPDAPGGVAFVPELIHNRSGVGSELKAIDINRDGAVDILAAGTRGTFVFWGSPR